MIILFKIFSTQCCFRVSFFCVLISFQRWSRVDICRARACNFLFTWTNLLYTTRGNLHTPFDGNTRTNANMDAKHIHIVVVVVVVVVVAVVVAAGVWDASVSDAALVAKVEQTTRSIPDKILFHSEAPGRSTGYENETFNHENGLRNTNENPSVFAFLAKPHSIRIDFFLFLHASLDIHLHSNRYLQSLITCRRALFRS